jgi:hypothetical protein
VSLLPLWDEPLAPEEREALLERIAGAVAARGLETPAVMALEMHRPFAFVASQGLIFFGPLLGPLLGIERMQNVSRLLREPGAVEALIRRIEDRAAARERGAPSGAPDSAPADGG